MQQYGWVLGVLGTGLAVISFWQSRRDRIVSDSVDRVNPDIKQCRADIERMRDELTELRNRLQDTDRSNGDTLHRVQVDMARLSALLDGALRALEVLNARK